MSKNLPKNVSPLSPGPLPQDGVEAYEIVLWDRGNPRSVINLLPEVVSTQIEEAGFEKSDLFRKTEQELYKYLSEQNSRPNATDNRLRLKFWHEYERVQGTNEKSMIMVNVIGGIVSREYFYSKYLHMPERLAWLMCPPTNYIVKAEEALEFALEQMRDILEMPHHLAGGKLDPKVADMKIKIFKLLDDRVRGAVVQKVHSLQESRSVSIVESRTTTQDAGAINGFVQGITQEETERRIKELELRKKQAQHIPVEISKDIIDV